MRTSAAITTEIADIPTLTIGAKGPAVVRLQEWLTLNGHSVVIDGDFGPATRAALIAFQAKLRKRGYVILLNGAVCSATSRGLLDSIIDALMFGSVETTYAKRVVDVAKRHLKHHPREVGGQNSGPWVRVYMDGRQGPSWPWCAGFVTHILRQAAPPDGGIAIGSRTFSCDVLANDYAKMGKLLVQPDAKTVSEKVKPGDLFFVVNRSNPSDRTHVGIVTKVEPGVVHTIEGNTNDEGSREGHEVCARVRGVGRLDFAIIP